MKPKRLATNAVLVAMYLVLSLVSINLGNQKITLDSLPILVGAALFGPVDGLIVGLLGSFLNQLLFSGYGLTPTTILWILPAGVRGAMVGGFAKHFRFEMTRGQTIFITVISALVVTALNTVVMFIDSKIYGYYSYVYVFGALVSRIIVGVVTAAVFALLLPTILRSLQKVVKR